MLGSLIPQPPPTDAPGHPLPLRLIPEPLPETPTSINASAVAAETAAAARRIEERLHQIARRSALPETTDGSTPLGSLVGGGDDTDDDTCGPRRRYAREEGRR